MKAQPVLRKRPSLFHRRIVIALDLKGAGLVAAAIGLAIFDRFSLVTTIIALIISIASLSCLLVARRLLREMRYQVHHILNGISDEDMPEEETETAQIFPMRRNA